MDDAVAVMLEWFARRGWQAFEFQRQVWQAQLAGRSGLVHAPTGSGKTLAVFGGPMIEGSRLRSLAAAQARHKPILRDSTPPLRVLWLTPMRALANDTAHALQTAATEVGLGWSVELRTSDTPANLRRKQARRLPSVLVTTPESLSLLLSYSGAHTRLASVRWVIVDEWHELMGSKRGVQTELGIARLRGFNPDLRTWGLSATLGNLPQAMRTLIPVADPLLIHAEIPKKVEIRTLLPESIERFPWGGHMGLRMLPAVIEAIAAARSTLIFTNTRAQAEIWFRCLLEKSPALVGQVALHHGSLDRRLRAQVEQMLRAGQIKAVVCTSSMDLGVDYSAVEQVIQIGSPKGIARLMQRAGRSGHRPGQPSLALCVPTHAFELVEFSAARQGIESRDVEPRPPLRKPLDVLVQHVLSCAAGDGFDPDALREQVRQTHAYAELNDQEWQWVLDFVRTGGQTLRAYTRFARVTQTPDGLWRMTDTKLAQTHRLTIGTITADAMVQVVTGNGRRLGSIEESFVVRLRPGDVFVFAGRAVQLLSVRQMTARVRPVASTRGAIPQWAGGRFPLSTRLASAVRDRLEQARNLQFADEEMIRVAPLLDVQRRWSRIPAPGELLIEQTRSREGQHLFLFPFLGRLVHEGLAAVLAHRLHQSHRQPVTATFTDYGIELLSPDLPSLEESAWRRLLTAAGLVNDLLSCLNTGELTRRQFREISRVAGLVVVNTPGAPRGNRQLQASSELFFDVFNEFDPHNLLLEQARREVLEQQLDANRLHQALVTLESQRLTLVQTKRFTPLSFPVWAQRIQSQTLRVESAQARIERMLRQLEADADAAEDLRQDARLAMMTPV